MLLQHIKRISSLSGLAPSELRMLARHIHVVCVPGRRWLIQPGHRVDGYFFLLKGSVRTTKPEQILAARANGSLTHFYPGPGSVQSVGQVQIMRIDAARYEFLTAANAGPELTCQDTAGWLQRFLASQMMRQLRPWHWQNLLKSCRRERFAARTCVVKTGEPGHECFVIERGHAIVRRAGSTRSHLGPGDFFGEDALLTRDVRNADVIALEDLWVHAIPQHAFNTILVDGLVQFVDPSTGGMRSRQTVLNVGCHPLTDAINIDINLLREEIRELNPKLSYEVIGGRLVDRALCSFVLRQQGIAACPVQDHEVISGGYRALAGPAAQ